MKTIHKYVLSDAVNRVSTYERAKFLHVANQSERITVWVEVNTLERECVRTVHVVGTGHKVPAGVTYVGSALVASDALVFHVYAEGEHAPTDPTESEA